MANDERDGLVTVDSHKCIGILGDKCLIVIVWFLYRSNC